jgi:hypothetical protein
MKSTVCEAFTGGESCPPHAAAKKKAPSNVEMANVIFMVDLRRDGKSLGLLGFEPRTKGL